MASKRQRSDVGVVETMECFLPFAGEDPKRFCTYPDEDLLDRGKIKAHQAIIHQVKFPEKGGPAGKFDSPGREHNPEREMDNEQG